MDFPVSHLFTVVKRIYNVIDELPLYKERLKDVIIENRNFENLIKTYDRPSAVFYIDHPYVESEGYYNKKYVSFNKDDHLRLNSVLKGIKGRLYYHITPVILFVKCIKILISSMFPETICFRQNLKTGQNLKKLS